MPKNNHTQAIKSEEEINEQVDEELDQSTPETKEQAEPIFNEDQTQGDEEDTAILKAKIEAQQKEIESLQNEQKSLNNRLLRTQADFDNFRRRANDEKVAAKKYRAQELIENLLPALDNFERALAVTVSHEEATSLKQGMEMVYRQLQDALQKEGIEEVSAEGADFDPNLHQAVMQVESDEHESNVVVEVLQKGYQLNGRVVRPAMVKVTS